MRLSGLFLFLSLMAVFQLHQVSCLLLTKSVLKTLYPNTNERYLYFWGNSYDVEAYAFTDYYNLTHIYGDNLKSFESFAIANLPKLDAFRSFAMTSNFSRRTLFPIFQN